MKSIPKFWPIALMNMPQIAIYLGHNVDQQALSYLEDLWVVRDPVEPRAFTLEFVSSFANIHTRACLK